MCGGDKRVSRQRSDHGGYDTQKIINTANSFFLGADRCSEQRPLALGQVQMLLVPAVVCKAFSIELYFKGIIAIEKGSATGHDLSTLFSLLTAPSQLTLRTGLSLSEIEFNQKLKDISSAFRDWRYIFERQSSNLDAAFLNGLASASKALAESFVENGT